MKRKTAGFDFSLLPVIFALAWPTMLEQTMQTAVQYIDTAMVGSLGVEATAAVGATTTINWLIGSTVSAFGIGFLPFIAQACGAGERERAVDAATQALLVAFAAGTFFTVAALGLSKYIPAWMQVDKDVQELASRYFFILYLPMIPRAFSIILGTVLRAAGDTKTPMRVGIMVNVVNVVLNLLLIYPTRTVAVGSLQLPLPGAGLGVAGAAWASAVAYAAGGVWTQIAVWRHDSISPKGKTIRINKNIMAPCLKVALPNMLQRFCTSFGYVVFAGMINSLGEASTAAHTIANTVESAFYIPAYGMMTASATLTGNCIGAGDEERRKSLARMIMALELAMMTVSGGLLFAFAGPLTGIFTSSEQVAALSTRVLRMVALSEPFYGVSIVTEGMLQGAGETRRPFIFNVGSMWGVRILGTLICVVYLGMGLASAWACMIAGNITLMVLFVACYKVGRWNPLTRQGSEYKT